MSPHGETSYSGRGSATEFCRTCTDFKTWAKLHTDKKPQEKVISDVFYRLCFRL